MTQAVDNDSIARADPLLCLYPTGASPPCFSLTLTTCNWKSRGVDDDDDDAKVAQVRASLFFSLISYSVCPISFLFHAQKYEIGTRMRKDA